MQRIALLGLGAMGTRFATNLHNAGYKLTVYNRSLDKTHALAQMGIAVATSPRQAAEHAEVVLAMTRDDQSSKAVWTAPDHGALHGLQAGALAIELSTLRPAWVQDLAQQVNAKQALFLEAPVVGSRPQAEAKQLNFLVGGEASTLEQARPVLQSLGCTLHHVGAVGQGSAMKLAVNALFAVQVAAVAELLVGLAQNGISASSAASLFGELPVTSPAVKGAMASMVQGNFAPMFPIDLVVKDLGYALESLGTAQPCSTAAKAIFTQAVAKGLGERNITGVAELYS
jgi:3-hydroxyisobutyrate dehydrogenase